ncbi:extracellular serine/threonine protein CG31145-like isoform X2 [Mercenaria mercenaria]|uniref:extracellular serine/threonine protein CG31145-like isoform X2 n=1 Tax=Mercenaria mercenaria TaxID=6596 RepID=UPI00234E4D92|nr:extracellular serine/threonine protein CG31145-like isoform X2 [Mercenaria mercenaria]
MKFKEEMPISMKRVQRIGRTIVLVALPMVVIFTLINMYLLTFVHRGSSETTFILNERVYNKNSDSSSKKLPELRKKDSRDDNAMNLRQFDDAEKELNKKSGDGDEVSPEVKDVKSAKDALVVMKDEAVDRMVEKLKMANNYSFFPSYFWNSSLHDLTRRLGATAKHKARTLPGYAQIKRFSGKMPAWKLFHRNIRQFSLYDPDDPNLYGMLIDMATLPMIEGEENDGGTQLKINVRFSNEGRAVIKFMRYPREVEADENRYIFDDLERHIAEIAAFQLDKTLGFYRVPPTIGRRVNITSELEPIMPKSIKDTLFKSPAGNLCFYGECDYYCDSAHAFCGHPDTIEISVQSYLPSRNIAKRKSWYQPWRRSYSKYRKAYWEKNDDLCDTIRNESPYNNGKLLLDMIDAHTFDFLSGNKDRHSFATFKDFGNYTFPIMYDNGRGFGRQTYDAMSILAPLRQCCLIRKSTLLKYVKLYVGPERLSVLMEKALGSDPIAPVLIKPHLNALDRRLLKILQAVAECIEKFPVNKVVVSDRF